MSGTTYVTVALLSDVDENGMAHVAIESSPHLTNMQVINILASAAVSLYEGTLGVIEDDPRDGPDLS